MPNPYLGSLRPGFDLFACDGDWTQCEPCGMPVMSFPVRGDSILSLNDIVHFYPDIPTYATVSLGTYPNIHPWNPNQRVMVLEQEFMVAQNAYFPMPLNTPYNVDWALGFNATFPSGYPSADIALMYLVEEGALEDMGAGISKLRRKWSTIPPTRCEIEQYCYQFVGLQTNGSVQRPPQSPLNVMSRLQYDYFIFDDLDILNLPLFQDGGNRLNATTGLYPAGIILPQMQYFLNDNLETAYGVFVGTTTDTLSDGDPSDPSTATLPTATDYLQWCTGLSTGNGQPAEIVAEPSTFTRFMGNIWERRTRFVLAQ